MGPSKSSPAALPCGCMRSRCQAQGQQHNNRGKGGCTASATAADSLLAGLARPPKSCASPRRCGWCCTALACLPVQATVQPGGQGAGDAGRHAAHQLNPQCGAGGESTPYTACCTPDRLLSCCSPGSSQLIASAGLQGWQSGGASDHMLARPASYRVLPCCFSLRCHKFQGHRHLLHGTSVGAQAGWPAASGSIVVSMTAWLCCPHWAPHAGRHAVMRNAASASPTLPGRSAGCAPCAALHAPLCLTPLLSRPAGHRADRPDGRWPLDVLHAPAAQAP